MNTVTSALPLVGRVMLSAIFISSGFAKLTAFSGTIGYVASGGVPFPELVLALTIALEIGGGIALLVGFQARLAALGLAAFSVLAGVMFHAFWADTDPAAAYANQINFWKNIAMAGGLLQVVAFGAGAYALDNVRRVRAALA